MKKTTTAVYVDRKRFFKNYLIIVIALAIPFNIVHFFKGNEKALVANSIAAGLCILLLFIRKIISEKNIYAFAVGILFFLFLFYLFEGDLDHTSIYWIFTLPIVAFFLRGIQRGFIWIGLFALSMILLVFLDHFTLIPPLAYSVTQFGSAFLALFCITIVVYSYEKVRNENADLIYRQNLELLKKTEIINSDLNVAKNIQHLLLPPGEFYADGVCIDTWYRPYMEIGGDFYDFFQLNDSIIRVLIADATGHGIQAAFMTAIIHSEYDMLKRTTSSPEMVLRELNKSFLKKYSSIDAYFTCIVLDINPADCTIEYSTAGHPPFGIKCDDGIHLLSTRNKMIGLLEEEDFILGKKEIRKGGIILLYTDGLLEEPGYFDSQDGEKILQVLDRIDSTGSINEAVLSELGVLERKEIIDDITLISIRCGD